MANLTRLLIVVVSTLCFCFGEQQRVSLEGVHSIATQEQVDEWIMHYYEHPRPDLAKSALLFCAKEGYLATKRVETPSVYFIFEEVLRANPSIKSDFLSAGAEGPADLKRAVAFALWVSGQGTEKEVDTLSTDATAPYIADLKKQRPIDLLSTKQISPTILDAFWAAFFVTGDERYVERVAEYVPWVEEKGDVAKLLVGGAARWSLTSNAVQHPKVLATTKRLAKQAEGRRKELLDQIIKNAEKELAS